jgi:hypothetical protein
MRSEWAGQTSARVSIGTNEHKGRDGTHAQLDFLPHPLRHDTLHACVCLTVLARHGAADVGDVRLERGGCVEEEDVAG